MMRVARTLFVAAALFVPSLGTAGAQRPDSPGSSSPAGWSADVRSLADSIRTIHPNPFGKITRAEFDQRVDAVASRIDHLSRPRALVELMQVAALIGDGHTRIDPWYDPGLQVRYYPVRFQLFSDGLFIRMADSAHRDLVGAKVIRIGTMSADEALAQVASVVSHDNDQWVRFQGPLYLGLVEILAGLGIVTDMEHAEFVVEQGGRRRTVQLAPAGLLAPAFPRLGPDAAIDLSSWVDMRDAKAPVPLWQRESGRIYWMEYLPDSHTEYVAYREVGTRPGLEPNAAFFRRVFSFADTAPVERLVLDLRENAGGNNGLNREVIRDIIATRRIDQPGKLFVILGRKTFSAAQNLVNEIEHYTNAVTVGEPTGSPPRMYGDGRPVRLGRSGILAYVSTLDWATMDPREHRPYTAPMLFTPLTSEEYRNGEDPAMKAILAYASRSNLAELLSPVLSGQNASGVIDVVRGYHADPLNRYRNVESEVNRLGYSLLGAGKTSEAILLFRANAAEFPQSANTYDSLGDGYARAGQREAAVEAYRHALRLAPGLPSATAALRQLGETP
jgi:hypothetical protein